MSSPSRLLRGRPTAPLPITRSEPHVQPSSCSSSTHELSKNNVREYLQSHRKLLEEIIMQDVTQEHLEEILRKKAQTRAEIRSQQRLLGTTVIQLTRLLLDKATEYETILQRIESAAVQLVKADRAAMFLVDASGKELYAQIFSVDNVEGGNLSRTKLEREVACRGPLPALIGDLINQLGRRQSEVIAYKGQQVKFSIDKGVVGYAAKTGELQNITDAQMCEYFNSEVDALTGYKTKTLLCAPLIVQKKVIGVLEAVNKEEGCFTFADEEVFQSLAVFCGLIVHSYKTQKEFQELEKKHKVTNEILAYHRQCSEEEFQRAKAIPLPTKKQYPIESFTINSAEFPSETKAQLVVTMLSDLVDTSQCDVDQLLRFSMTVCKNYRNEPYHNWDHGFSVAHCMYWILKGAPHRFTELEKWSLFWAALCHDLDHRGFNNAFLTKTNAPMAKLYPVSTLECHHFCQTLALLQLDGLNIFSHLTEEEYKMVLTIIQKAILATDLVNFFENKKNLSNIIQSGLFSWDIPRHKELAQCLMMTICDLNCTCKPWKYHVASVEALFEEFYNQGDFEKSMGLEPIQMMDRDFKHQLASCQVGFIKGITKPCCLLLRTALPHMSIPLEGALNNMEQWENIVESQKKQN